ncbi:MAG TPA: ABC transporter permease [Pirellulaceae bacterium]|nr:ABC transporter permease [Pirellulaceae bacterium]
MSGDSFLRTFSVARKELLHILRDPQTLFFTLFVPVLELFMLGYAIDTNVRNVRTVIVDHAGTQESRQLIEKFEKSQDFRVVAQVFRDDEVSELIVAGKARVGIIIPENFSRRLEAGQTAQFLVDVDGTESSIAAEAVNVSNAIALKESLERALGGRQLPIEARPRVLFNPDTRSANFFIPGLMVVMCQMMSTMLSANAIVREKELGTLEQLFMTPVRRGELIFGKMSPYVVLTMFEFCFIAFLMWSVFQVPIHGSFVTLLLISFPFFLANLGVGLWISTKAATREAAGQMALGTFLPSIFLSGYVFPIDSMPALLKPLAYCFHTTWMIDASRSVILRGGGWNELSEHASVLWCMAAGALVFGSLQVKKRL